MNQNPAPLLGWHCKVCIIIQIYNIVHIYKIIIQNYLLCIKKNNNSSSSSFHNNNIKYIKKQISENDLSVVQKSNNIFSLRNMKITNKQTEMSTL